MAPRAQKSGTSDVQDRLIECAVSESPRDSNDSHDVSAVEPHAERSFASTETFGEKDCHQIAS